MLKNYLKTAFRNLLRERTSTIINLSGLTLGITCSLVLYLIVTYHNSFDTFQSRRDRIYRVVTQSEGNNGKDYQSGTPTVLPDAFRMDFPEVEQVAFTSYRSEELVSIPQRDGTSKKFHEKEGVVYTESSFLKIFDIEITQGDGIKSLDDPNEAIISEGWAQRYFGKTDVIGEIVRFENKDFKVSAVMKDPPSNTDFPFHLMLSYPTIKKEREEEGWHSIWSDEQTFFLLKENESIANVQARMMAFSKKYIGADDPDKTEFFTQPMSDFHFDERFDLYSYSAVPRTMLFAFGIVAFILVITACINFINLSTAEAIKRSKEIGIRKTMGSSRAQLIFQFLGETTMITLIAIVLSLGITQLTLNFINPFMKLNLKLDFAGSDLLMFLAIVTGCVSLFSGLYPAWVVSGYKPALALKNQVNNRNSSGYWLRKGLVVTQFVISQFFIIGTIVVIKQTNYFHEKDLGFRKDAILILPVPFESGVDIEKTNSKKKALRNELSAIAGVEEVSLASSPPSSGNVSKTMFKVKGRDTEYVVQIKRIDKNYIPLYGLKLLSGKNVDDLDTANGFVVNQEFARVAGFENAESMIGTEITRAGHTSPVIGVVNDFHTVSLRNPIEPTALFNQTQSYNTIAIKASTANLDNLIREAKEKWEASYPDQLFEYEFLDDSIRQFYEGERKMATLLGVFTSIAIFIGCLGLFGLATFMTNQRTKEIGVRKVLGASVESIVMMFTREYAWLILIGFLVSAPLAGFAMQQFLNEFSYKIPLSAGIFALSLGLTVLIAVVTVGYKSISAAIVNPVKSLRYE